MYDVHQKRQHRPQRIVCALAELATVRHTAVLFLRVGMLPPENDVRPFNACVSLPRRYGVDLAYLPGQPMRDSQTSRWGGKAERAGCPLQY